MSAEPTPLPTFTTPRAAHTDAVQPRRRRSHRTRRRASPTPGKRPGSTAVRHRGRTRTDARRGQTMTTTTCPVPDTSADAGAGGESSPPDKPARVCAFRVRVWPDPRAWRQLQAVRTSLAPWAGETAPGRSASSVTERPQPDRAVDDVALQGGRTYLTYGPSDPEVRRRVCAVFALTDKRLSRSSFRARVGHVVPSLCRVWVG